MVQLGAHLPIPPGCLVVQHGVAIQQVVRVRLRLGHNFRHATADAARRQARTARTHSRLCVISFRSVRPCSAGSQLAVCCRQTLSYSAPPAALALTRPGMCVDMPAFQAQAELCKRASPTSQHKSCSGCSSHRPQTTQKVDLPGRLPYKQVVCARLEQNCIAYSALKPRFARAGLGSLLQAGEKKPIPLLTGFAGPQ